jgi:hypothetical protein
VTKQRLRAMISDNGAGPDLTLPVIAAASEYVLLHNHDADAIRFALAVATTVDLNVDPLWGLVVGGPSNTKTEIVRLVESIADRHVDELTVAGLLSFKTDKRIKPDGGKQTGVLAGMDGRHLFVTIGDYTVLLAGASLAGRDRDQIFRHLRRCYDGELVRNIGQAPTLIWTGRLTLLGAVTSTIDRFSAHDQALGPRWLLLRMSDPPRAQRRRTAEKVRDRRKLAEFRAEAGELAARAVTRARERLTDDDPGHDIIDLAEVVTLARSDVPRDGYGKREIIGLSDIEGPARLTVQLQQLGQGLRALGVPTADAKDIVCRAGLDSMPRDRHRALQVLALGERLATNEISARTRMAWHVAQRTLEDLQQLELVDNARVKDESGERHAWFLANERASAISELFVRKRESTPPTPPNNKRKERGERGVLSDSCEPEATTS